MTPVEGAALPPAPPPHWVVGFMAQAGRPAWYQRLLRPGYAHCWAAKWLASDLWLWVEWTPERLIFGMAGDALVCRAMGAAHEVLRFEQPEDAPHPPRPVLALHHCASIVSHAIGLRPKPWATPWRLRCALLRRGAQRIPLQAEVD